jgi:RNA polymerase sigma factor (sigma-70 family)
LEYGTDHIFLEKLKQRETQACKQLYMQYADAMYNVCIRILQHQSDAEDALQESFIKIFNNINQYRNESSIGSWMKQIVTNTCLNVVRAKKLITLELNENIDLYVEEAESSEFNEITYSTEEIKAAVDALSDGYRIVFNLYMFEDYSHKQIAELLEISESTAKTQLFKAKRKLKGILTEQKKQHG